MSIGRSHAVTLSGLDGAMIGVEAHTANGLPAFKLVGLPDASLSEARDRVRAAIESCGITFPRRRITVGLNPADVPKAGSVFDVAIAIAILRAERLVRLDEELVFIGELGLDGRIHPVRGVLPIVSAAVKAGFSRILVPRANAAEASLIPRADIEGVTHLAEVVHHLGGLAEPPDLPRQAPPEGNSDPLPAADPPDLADLIGQHEARAALEVAAAGGHHVYLTGPPGVGKTMLAARLPGILPDLRTREAITVTSVHSVAGTLNGSGLIRRPPFEAPHHSATMAALIGGGSGMPRPGAASRAHLGVLFLDEARDGKCTSLNKEEAHEHITTPARRQCSSRPYRPIDGLSGLHADRPRVPNPGDEADLSVFAVVEVPQGQGRRDRAAEDRLDAHAHGRGRLDEIGRAHV